MTKKTSHTAPLHHIVFLLIGLCCIAMQATAQVQADTVVVDKYNDTLLLRKTFSAWRFGVMGSGSIGANTGFLRLGADRNNAQTRAAFVSEAFGSASALHLAAEASWQAPQSLLGLGTMRYGGRVGFTKHTAWLQYLPSPEQQDSVLQSAVSIDALSTSIFAETHDVALPRLMLFAGIEALWGISAVAKTTTNRFRQQNSSYTTTENPELLTLALPALGVSVGAGYTLRTNEWSCAVSRITPLLALNWQPVLSSSDNSSWGTLIVRFGVSCTLEPFRADTLSVQPFIRFLPIVLLPETPLADLIREDEAVTGRIASARESRDAVLEERVVVYRPDNPALLGGIPREAIDIMRSVMPYLLSGAHCRLVLTIPSSLSASATTSVSVAQAEKTLSILADYGLRRGVAETSIEAGIAENRYAVGDAWQLRIRVVREVR